MADLTEAVEAAARVTWEHDFGGNPSWEAGAPLHKHYYREGMTPVVHAAYPAIREAVLAELRAVLASEDAERVREAAEALGLTR